ncbi:LOW QUALITY PROTEIN: hypothetical protein PanWU01x14_346690, partial [Parasponia andersonii]
IDISSDRKSSSKLGFYEVDNFISYLEGFSQHLIWNWWCSEKERCGVRNNPGQLTIEGNQEKCLTFSNIKLEVNKSPGNDKHLPGSQNLGVENIVSCDEPHKELPFDDHARLCTRMRVGRIQTTRCQVSSDHGNPLSVEPRKCLDIRSDHTESKDVTCVTFFAHSIEEEIL